MHATTRFSAILVFVVLILSIQPVGAEERQWVGYQNDCMVTFPQTASWFHEDNWFNFTNPGNGDDAVLGSHFDPQDNGWPTNLFFGETCLDVFACPGEIWVEEGTAECWNLMIQDGDWVFDFDSHAIGSCGPPSAGNTGSLQVGWELVIGQVIQETGLPGDASLELRDGVSIVGYLTRVGEGGEGDLVVGQGALLSTWGLRVGHPAHGYMTIQDGGRVEFQNMSCVVAEQEGSSGELLVTGTGSELVALNNMVSIGKQGSGLLSVNDSGHVEVAVDFHLGSYNGGDGHVTIHGASVNVENYLYLGGTWVEDSNGRGEMHLVNGGQFTALEIFIPTNPSNTGVLEISGTDSRLRAERFCRIGRGAATVTIDSGGELISGGDIHIGDQNNTQVYVSDEGLLTSEARFVLGAVVGGGGTVHLNDSGTIMEWSAGNTVIGMEGTGYLYIANGAVLKQTGWGNLEVGAGESGVGGVSVVGVGSEIQQVPDLIIGSLGQGLVEVTGGAVIDCQNSTFIGYGEGGQGEMLVSGPDSRLDCVGALWVGGAWFESGDVVGTLQITNGGTVQADGVHIGSNGSTNVGEVTVRGSQAVLSSSSVWCGSSGLGTITVDQLGTLTTEYINIQSQGVMIAEGMVTGNLNNEGVVRPGSPLGELLLEGGYQQYPSGTLEFEIETIEGDVYVDRMVVNGTAQLAGEIFVSIDAASEESSSVFVLLEAAQINGEFDEINVVGGLGSVVHLDNMVVYMPEGVSPVDHGQVATPLVTRLFPNYPNPFNPVTTIQFELAQAGPVTLEVFDPRGRLVSSLYSQTALDSGQKSVAWQGRDNFGRALPSGLYFYRLETTGFEETRSMTLVR